VLVCGGSLSLRHAAHPRPAPTLTHLRAKGLLERTARAPQQLQAVHAPATPAAAPLLEPQHVGARRDAALAGGQLHAAAAASPSRPQQRSVLPQQRQRLCRADARLELKLHQGQDVKGGKAAQEGRAAAGARVTLRVASVHRVSSGVSGASAGGDLQQTVCQPQHSCLRQPSPAC
jgi:hypothetical protein